MCAESLPRFSVCGTGTSSPSTIRRARRRKAVSRASIATVQTLESRMMLSASLIKNINTTYADASPSNFATSTNLLYFTADDGIHGTQWWQTAGTSAGTTQAVSLVPGAPQATMSDITVANGSVYFFAQGPSDGNAIGLYKSAGSAATTSELGSFNEPSNLINFNGTLYFTTADGSVGQQIWISHGTAASTSPLVDTPAVSYLTDADGELYFLSGTTLWKSDGTQAGTMAVASVANQTGTVEVDDMVAVGNRAFVLDSGELWTSDGTAAGTQTVPNVYGASAMASYDGALYYTDFGYTDQLWKTDGTSAGTSLIVSQSNQTYNGEPSVITVANNTLYFNFADPAHGEELWKSDGTSEGTSLVADIDPGPARGFGPVQNPYNYGDPVDEIGVLNGVVYFPGTNGVNGAQLWRSDGTAAGTYQLDQINTSTNSSYPGGALTIGGTTYFTADDGIHGYELWKTDGTSGGTMMVDDLNVGGGDSSPADLTNLNGTLYFTAFAGTTTNLYKTDGTTAGTSVVAQGLSYGAADLTPAGNYLYFIANDSTGDTDLFRTNGTQPGTTMIQTLLTPTVYKGLATEVAVTEFDGTAYFLAPGGNSPYSLWKVNPNGSTTAIASFAGADYNACELAVMDNTLYFAADDANRDMAIWKSDGTSSGTSMVWTTGQTFGSAAIIENFYTFNHLLFFTVNEEFAPTATYGVYRTDGTSAGTVLLTNAGAPDDFFGQFVAAGNSLYFDADVDPATGDQLLYITDGTAAGTSEIAPSINVYSMAPANGTLYFSGQSNGGARQLYQASVTAISLVDPSETAAAWQANALLGQVGNTFLFQGSDAQHGNELWGVPLTASATASFSKPDTTTRGNWTGVYGGDGYSIIGGSTSLPSYVTLNTSDASYYQWAAPGQADYLAPQVSPGSSQYVAACDFAPSSFTVHLDFTDGQVHQVAFDLLDYDYQNRVETVQVANGDSGQVLDTRTVSNFETGQYLVYDLSGNVAITFANAGRPNAVLSAILFGPTAATTTATFAGVDSSTQGHWTGTYGSQGYDVFGGSSNLPSDVDLSMNGEQFYTWAASTTDPRALQTSPGSSTGVAACAYSNASSFTIDLDFLDNNSHQVALYLLDYDYQNRFETIQISNALTGAVLDTEPVSNFTGGEYARWDVSGDIQITISNRGGLNEVVSGIFIGPPTATATYVKQDYQTQGNYTGVYGKDGYDVFNATFSLPSYATLNTPYSVQTYNWSTTTTSPAALQDAPGSTARIAGCDYSDSPSFTFNLDLTDGKTHQVAFYFLDYDNQNRNELMLISDASSGVGLAAVRAVNFVGGEYIVLDLSGDVNITITNSGGLNEVLSGIFFG
jgi:ELWxxDGT repeat protein